MTAIQKGRVQQAMLQVLDDIERGISTASTVKASRVDRSINTTHAEVNTRELENVLGSLIELGGTPSKEARAKGRRLARDLIAPKANATDAPSNREANHDPAV